MKNKIRVPRPTSTWPLEQNPKGPRYPYGRKQSQLIMTIPNIEIPHATKQVLGKGMGDVLRASGSGHGLLTA